MPLERRRKAVEWLRELNEIRIDPIRIPEGLLEAEPKPYWMC